MRRCDPRKLPICYRVAGDADLKRRLDSCRVERFEEQPASVVYSLTSAGRKQLNAEPKNWHRVTGAVDLVLQRV